MPVSHCVVSRWGWSCIEPPLLQQIRTPLLVYAGCRIAEETVRVVLARFPLNATLLLEGSLE